MRIDRIDLFHVAMPLIYPWRTAYGEDAAVHSVLCRMCSGSLDAWGESTPLAAPCYSGEWAGGVFATVKEWLAPAIVGMNIDSGQQLQKALAIYKSNSFAKATLDTAWWSLNSKMSGQPLHAMIGANRTAVPVGADFGVMDSIDELLNNVSQAVESGFPRIKLKFRPGWDLDMVRAVRKQHGDWPIHIDCNSGYTREQLPMFRELDELQMAMIEQPLAHDDLIDHAELQAQIKTPVCLDESIKTPRHAEQAIALESCRYVNVKPGRVGGMTNAIVIHDRCRQAGIPCWVGGMLESAVGASQCVALSMLENFTYPADIFPSSRFYHEDLADPPLELCRSSSGEPRVRAFDVLPEPVPERLETLTVERATIQ